jgi:hypothetical protein
MLEATELYQLTPLLKGILWVEVIVYLGLGLFEVFDDFLVKPKSWMTISDRPNGYLVLVDKVGHKMHATVCFLLGFVALNGITEGAVTRFELELCFVSLALLMMTIWMTMLPGRLGMFIVTLTKPEFWIQILMMAFFVDLIRPWVVMVCLGLNGWGVIVYFAQTRRHLFRRFEYSAVRDDLVEVGLEQAKIDSLDKMAGFKRL